MKITNMQAAVTLLYFNAVSGDEEVNLIWETGTELDTAGFFVQRSNQQNGTYQRINIDIIPATGDSHTGASYTYADTDVTNGVQYWYRLESIDFSQNSEFSDPVSAIPGSVSSATTTVTATITTTLTPTSTSAPGQNSTSTSTATLTQPSSNYPTSTVGAGTIFVPTSTAPYPGPVSTPAPPQVNPPAPLLTATLLATSSIADQEGIVGGTGEGTATLMPFPTVTILFPTMDPQNLAPLPYPIDNSRSFLSPDQWGKIWPIGLIILIWLGLAIWFFLSRHHLN